jgi:hypothetical protein
MSPQQQRRRNKHPMVTQKSKEIEAKINNKRNKTNDFNIPLRNTLMDEKLRFQSGLRST